MQLMRISAILIIATLGMVLGCKNSAEDPANFDITGSWVRKDTPAFSDELHGLLALKVLPGGSATATFAKQGQVDVHYSPGRNLLTLTGPQGTTLYLNFKWQDANIMLLSGHPLVRDTGGPVGPLLPPKEPPPANRYQIDPPDSGR